MRIDREQYFTTEISRTYLLQAACFSLAVFSVTLMWFAWTYIETESSRLFLILLNGVTLGASSFLVFKFWDIRREWKNIRALECSMEESLLELESD